MSETELAAVAFTPSEVAAITAALAASGARGPATLAAVRKLAAAVVCADERAVAPDVAPATSTREPAAVAVEPAPAVGRLKSVGGAPVAVEPAPADNVVQLRNRSGVAVRPAIDSRVREIIEQAVADRRVVQLTYGDGHGAVSEREVEPAGILAASGRWYLIGWCRSRRDGRGFRLDRILSAVSTGEPAPDRDMPSVLGPLGRGERAEPISR